MASATCGRRGVRQVVNSAERGTALDKDMYRDGYSDSQAFVGAFLKSGVWPKMPDRQEYLRTYELRKQYLRGVTTGLLNCENFLRAEKDNI